jgi:hypothetical protein
VQDAGTQGIYVAGTTLEADDLLVESCAGAGIELSGTTAVIQSSTFAANGAAGVRAVSPGSVLLTQSTIAGNQGAGLHLQSLKATVDHCDVHDNGLGIVLLGGAYGSITWTNVLQNAREGLLFLANSGSQPFPGVHYNNVYGNCTVECGVLNSPSLSVSTTLAEVVTVFSETWSAPNGQEIVAARVAHEVTGVSLPGFLYSAEDKLLASVSYGHPLRYIDLTAGNILSSSATGMYLKLVDEYANRSATLSVPTVYTRMPGAIVEVAALTDTSTVDVSENFWGIYPNVSSVGLPGHPTALDMTDPAEFELVGAGAQ